MEVHEHAEIPPTRSGKRAANTKKEPFEATSMKRKKDELAAQATPLALDVKLPVVEAMPYAPQAKLDVPPAPVGAPLTLVAANDGVLGNASSPSSLSTPAPPPTQVEPTSDRLAALAALGLLGLVGDMSASATPAPADVAHPPAAPAAPQPSARIAQHGAAAVPSASSLPPTRAYNGPANAAMAAQAKMQALAANARSASLSHVAAAPPPSAASTLASFAAGKTGPAAPANFEVSTAALVATMPRPPAAQNRSVSMPLLKKEETPTPKKTLDDKEKQPSKRSLILLEKKAQGLCTAPGCDAKAEGGFRRCTACRNHDRERQRRLRAEAMNQGAPAGATATAAAAVKPASQPPIAAAQSGLAASTNVLPTPQWHVSPAAAAAASGASPAVAAMDALASGNNGVAVK